MLMACVDSLSRVYLIALGNSNREELRVVTLWRVLMLDAWFALLIRWGLGRFLRVTSQQSKEFIYNQCKWFARSS